jgi:hypothetical protein
MKTILTMVLSTFLFCLAFSQTYTGKIILPGQDGAISHDEVVLFAFDHKAFPYHKEVRLHLLQARDGRIILEPGEKGSHDEFVRYYGTVIRINDKFHMWYFGNYGEPTTQQGLRQGGYEGDVMCYAISDDGIHWTKPNLGMVEYRGSKNNNIIDFPEKKIKPAAAILYEPDEEDQNKKFKMAYEQEEGNKFCVAFSPDGLHWTLSDKNPVMNEFFEMAGITKHDGLYYINGQDGLTNHQPFRNRVLATYSSMDFENWSPCAAVGFDRSDDLSGPSIEHEWNNREEIHLRAALWNRGNVILGIYGQWHGHPTGDRRLVGIDLGLIITHDALHYSEPIKDFKFIPAREHSESAYDIPALMQGQGMENVGGKTFYWYSLWRGNEGSGVRLATWDRDRFGILQPFKVSNPMAITCPIRLNGEAKVYVNASGLDENSKLEINILDKGFQPIEGFSNEAAAIIDENGFRVPVKWGKGETLTPKIGDFHIQVKFIGVRPEDCKLHAVYVV